MKKLTYIDNSPNRPSAFQKWTAEIDKTQWTVEPYLNVWGNGPEEKRNISPGDAVFLHANDTVNPGWAQFAENDCGDTYVILFSGEGVKGIRWNNRKHYAHSGTINDLRDMQNQWNLPEFLEALKAGDEHPFDALTGFSEELENKLKLLHQMLTPDGARTLKEKKKCDQLILSYWDSLVKSESVKPEMLDSLIKAGDPFCDEFVQTLTALRDQLLEDQ